MQLDLFYELSVPNTGKYNEQQVFHNTLEEITLADQCGFKTAWLVEHHFMQQYSHSSCPELFLAALTQKTHHIRLGHAIIPLPYNHPIRVAERLATLDILSNGRVEFGFGRGFSPTEYQAFGVDMADSRTITHESLDIILASFTGQPINYQGKHFHCQDIELSPKVIQQPHPPIWSAAVSPTSFEYAAKLGIGVLAGPFKPWFMIKEDIKSYHQAWQKQSLIDPDHKTKKPRVGMTLGVYCTTDKKQARTQAKTAFEWFYQQLFNQTKPILQQLYASYEYYRKFGHFQSLLEKTINLTILETLGMAIVGDPEHCIKKLKILESAGVDHVLCAIGAGALPTELTKQSMQLIADEVMPEFHHQP